MRRTLPCVVLAAAAFLIGSAPAAFAQPLPTDDRLVTGKLDNGLSYIIRRHNNPPGRAVMWIHMDSGSLNETDKQRGIAHYTEHMAFNGSENFAPGSLVPFFESLGMTFGRDQNAFTNMEQTTYQLTMPDTKPETLGKGFTFLSDVVSKLSLLPKEIDDERQIILEERRRGLSARQRTSFYVLEHIAPGSIYGQRITIGTEDTIKGVGPQDFRDYYDKYYTASNATVLVVADADPATIVPLIQEKFGSLPKKPKPARQEIGVKPTEKSFAIVATDPDLTGADVQITHVDTARPPATTVPQMRTELVETISEQSFGRRMRDKVDNGTASFLRANASMRDQSGVIRMSGVSASSEPAKWKAALNEVALELQRARKFGFTSEEVDEIKKQILSGAERAAQVEDTMPAARVIGSMNNTLARGGPIMSAAQRLKLVQELLPSITKEEVSAYFAKEMEPKAVAFVLTAPSAGDIPTEAELLKMGEAALAVEPKAEAEVKHAQKLMDQLPKAGKVAESDVHEGSGVWSGWLANNIRVHHRFMDYHKNEVTVAISLIGGDLLETADNRGIGTAAGFAFSHPATSKLTAADIRAIMSGKKVRVGGTGSLLTISGSPEELETGMQLAYLLLTDPKIEQAPFDQMITQMIEGTEASMREATSVGQRTLAALRFPDGEVRTAPLTVEQIRKLKAPDAQAWLNKQIATAPIEVSIVGDISREKAIDLVTRYLGALPSRERVSAESFTSLRKLKRPKGPRTADLQIATKTPTAWVYSGFYGTDAANTADARVLDMACRILSTRMTKQIREEAQLVYSIGSSSTPGTVFPGFGMVAANAPTEPAKAKALSEKLASMYAAVGKDGVTEEELTKAKGQFAKTYEDQMREPSHWQAKLDQMTFRGRNLDDVLADPAAYQAITADQIKTVWNKYYSPETVVAVTVVPKPGSAAAEPAPKGDAPKVDGAKTPKTTSGK